MDKLGPRKLMMRRINELKQTGRLRPYIWQFATQKSRSAEFVCWSTLAIFSLGFRSCVLTCLLAMRCNLVALLMCICSYLAQPHAFPRSERRRRG